MNIGTERGAVSAQYNLPFYLQYLIRWPEYFEVAETPSGRYIHVLIFSSIPALVPHSLEFSAISSCLLAHTLMDHKPSCRCTSQCLQPWVLSSPFRHAREGWEGDFTCVPAVCILQFTENNFVSSCRFMGYVMGKAEGLGENWHGHVTAITVAPEFRRIGLGLLPSSSSPAPPSTPPSSSPPPLLLLYLHLDILLWLRS